ncbi:hypothetical protein F2Q70_00029640 [Brassica cretica]|uniref:Uncharacterized protein n=2 Tax=Brassica cretica TaxID=69181 RepID=A0A8S9FPJ7_BRACR|nr:hypothetical protein F2Q70_00029640 [Brassica cretica]KAF2552165.1 hypothetical protein F2Q68_00034075 [Brassica cretica]KAF3597724.1 hypothetical protein DY000_02021472 [Brassica cretica]
MKLQRRGSLHVISAFRENIKPQSISSMLLTRNYLPQVRVNNFPSPLNGDKLKEVKLPTKQRLLHQAALKHILHVPNMAFAQCKIPESVPLLTNYSLLCTKII